MNAIAALRNSPTLRRGAAVVGLAVLCALAIAEFPREATIEVAQAREMALDYALRRGAQLGTDLLTLGGPLAGLASGTHSNGALWPYYWWQLLSPLILGTALAWLAFKLPPARRWWFLALFLSATALRPAASHPALATTFAVALVILPLKAWEFVAFGAILGGLGLVELPLFLIGAAGLGLAGAVRPDRRRAVAGGAATAIVTFVGGGAIAGQHPANIPSWIAAGWSALAPRELLFDPRVWTGAVGLSALVGVCAVTWLVAEADASRRLRTGVGLIVLFGLGAIWIRNIGHLDGLPQNFFAAAGAIALALGALLPGVTARRVLIGSGAFIAGMAVSESRLLSQPIILLNGKVVQNTERWFDRRGWQREVRDKSRAAAAVFALPEIKSAIGGRPMDLLGDALGYALLNDFNYRPRPTLLSLDARSPVQWSRNGAHLAAADSPEFVVQRLQSWNGSLPATMDPAAQFSLYYGYEFLRESSTFLLWRRRAGPMLPSPSEGKIRGSLPVAWDRPLTLPTRPDRALWLRVNARPTLLGVLRRWIWPASLPEIALRDQQGNVSRYRLPIDAARHGFLINPHFRGEFDIAAYHAGIEPPLIRELTVESAGSAARHWELTGIEWIELPLPPQTGQTQTAEALAERYRMFNRLPQSINTTYPPAPVEHEGANVLLVSPDGALEFPALPGDTRVSGAFGMIDNSFLNGNATDGVEFVIEHHSVAGEPRVLMRRHLDPLNEPTDRGRQRFEVVLPQPAAGRIVLRTTNRPERNGAWDWSYWAAVRFE